MGNNRQRTIGTGSYTGTHFSDRRQLRPNYYYRPGQPIGTAAHTGSSSGITKWGLRGASIAAVAWLIFFVMPLALKRSQNVDATDNQQQSESASANQISQTPAPPAKQTSTDQEMEAAIKQAIAAHSSVETSVTIVDIRNNKTYHYGLSEDIVYVAASVGKVITASYYLHLTEDGTRTLTEKVGATTALEQITAMIEQSDNQAWDALNKLLTWKKLGEYAKSIGISHYDPADNTLTTGDIALLFTKIQQGTLLSKDNNALLLQKLQNANRTDFIKAAVPKTVNVYHKAGWLEDRSHDAAIIDDGRDPYVLVIFTKGAAAGQTGRVDIIHRVTQATVDRFIGKTDTTDSTAPQ